MRNQFSRTQLLMGAEGIEAGFLMIQNLITHHNPRPYLLSFGQEGLVLYCIKEEERLEQLIQADGKIEVSSKDVIIEYRDIKYVRLTLKTVLSYKRIHLTVHTYRKKMKYMVTSKVSSRQVEELFAKHSTIYVENKIKEEFQQSEIIAETEYTNQPMAIDIIATVNHIGELDDETIRRKRTSRNWRIVLTILSFVLTFTLMALALIKGSTLPLIGTLLWPIVILGFHIARQEDFTLWESRFGKLSISPAYGGHFIVSVIIGWWIIFEWWECTCISRHPEYGLYGGIGAILFFMFARWRILEFRGKSNFDLAFISILFGLQIISVLIFRLHF